MILEKYVKLRAALKPYIEELSRNVTARGVPTVRPLWWNFPGELDIDDQYLFGPDLLVAPVFELGSRSRTVRFPGTSQDTWISIFNHSKVHMGGTNAVVEAPIEIIPVFKRGKGRSSTLDVSF